MEIIVGARYRHTDGTISEIIEICEEKDTIVCVEAGSYRKFRCSHISFEMEHEGPVESPWEMIERRLSALEKRSEKTAVGLDEMLSRAEDSRIVALRARAAAEMAKVESAPSRSDYGVGYRAAWCDVAAMLRKRE